ncbi:MAG: ABC transporter substrate-binding protein [Armatimonadetes bacterium]|nr:ABC transporter substrate-binding protein [Armatimonadota bacterium]
MRRLAALLALVMVLAVLGISRPGWSQSATEFRFATNEDMVNLDPAQLSIAGDRLIAENIYNGLLRFKPGTTEVLPDLAEDFTVSPDGKTWAFKIRRGVQFHRGFGELTSRDVKFTIERHLDPATRSRERLQFVLVDRIETPDPYTVRFVLKEPSATFAGTLAWHSGFVMSERATRALGKDIAFKAVGTGPFMMESWIPGEKIVLVGNENFFRGRPAFRQITFRVIQEDLVAIYALLKGEIDAVAVRQIGGYRAVSRFQTKLKLFKAPGGWQYWGYVQTKKAPTSDQRVREAIGHAVNIEKMSESMGGFVDSNPSFFNPLILGWTKNVGAYRHDPRRARMLFEQAAASQRIKIIYSKAHLYEEYALMLKDQLSPYVGVDVELIDRALFGRKMAEGDWNIGVWAVTRLEADQYLSPFLHSRGPVNYSKYTNPEMDRLIEAARKEMNTERRKQLHVDIQKLVAKDLPIVAMGTMQSIVAARPEVFGIQPHTYVGLINLYTARIGAAK